MSGSPGFGTAGPVYGAVAAVMGVCFVLLSLVVLRAEDDRPARQLFGFSILYLFALFAALLAEHGLGLFRPVLWSL